MILRFVIMGETAASSAPTNTVRTALPAPPHIRQPYGGEPVAKKQKRPARKGILNNTTLTLGVVALTAVIAVGLWLAFDGGSTPARKLLRQTPVVRTEQQVSVEVIDKDYVPRTLTVNKGAAVTWKFTGDLPHNVTDDRGAFASDTLAKDGEYTRKFDAAGVFYYYCTIHHGMQGTLTVKE